MQTEQDTRERILEHANRLLEAEGSGRVRMSDVARAAGVSRQAVYLHFGSRAGLLLGLAAHADDRQDLAGLQSWVMAASGPREILKRITRLQVVYNPRIDAVAAAFQHAAPTDPDMAAAFQSRMDERLRGMRGVVARLVDWEALRTGLSPDRAAELAWGILSLGVWRSLVVELGWSPDEYCEYVGSTLESALLGE